MMRAFRVVLDTNCLVSALLFNHSRLSELRKCWRTGRIIPLACKETVRELIRVLAYPKFRLTEDEIREVLGDIVPFLETSELRSCIAIEGLRDASDAIFIHLARQSKADFLVTGDADILALQNSIPEVTISSPADFLAAITD
jgi:putative PIN family toxin of toxin-antitoxin system